MSSENRLVIVVRSENNNRYQPNEEKRIEREAKMKLAKEWNKKLPRGSCYIWGVTAENRLVKKPVQVRNFSSFL